MVFLVLSITPLLVVLLWLFRVKEKGTKYFIENELERHCSLYEGFQWWSGLSVAKLGFLKFQIFLNSFFNSDAQVVCFVCIWFCSTRRLIILFVAWIGFPQVVNYFKCFFLTLMHRLFVLCAFCFVQPEGLSFCL